MKRYSHPDIPGTHGDSAFTLNEVQYPGVWWGTVSPQKIASMGFVKLEDPEPQAPSTEHLVEMFRTAIRSHVENTATSRDYDNAASLAGYVNSTVHKWSTEALAFVAWRDAVWTYAIEEMDKVLGGRREQPTVETFLAELPEIVWPA